MSRRREWVAITSILLLAAALRCWGLGQVPPGLAHDEVANWLIAQDILAGRHAIYFTAAYGHEPLYQYAQTTAVALLGDHWLGLRYVSVAFGLLGLATTYVLVRRLFGIPTGLLTIGWLATSFWPLFYARVALRAISLPFAASLCAYFLFRAIDTTDVPPTAESPCPRASQPTGSGATMWLLTGLFLGMSVYTYMASRILPAIFVAFLIYFFLTMRSRAPIPWLGMLLFLLTAAIVSAPLVLWLATHPGAEYRIAEVQEPLTRLLRGDAQLVWENAVANFKFFTVSGDPWPRQNLPGRPVFADPISAVLFVAGLLIALWRWRDTRYGFLLIWLVGSLAPSIVTSGAPSSIRDILGLVVVFVFPALAVVKGGRWVKGRMQDAGSRMYERCLLPLVSCPLLLAPCLFLTVRDYFFVWPQNDVVHFDYQADLTAVAHRLDKLEPGTSITVAGLSVHTMDGPGLELAARHDVSDVRLCDTRETLVVPAGRERWLFVPGVVPFEDDLRERLLRWEVAVETDPGLFTGYRLADDAALERDLQRLERAVTLPDGTPVALPISFDGGLAFLGYEWTQPAFAPGDSPALLTYWRVEAAPVTPVRVFVHVIGDSDAPLTQHDGLGSPPRGWAAGDLIIQKHTFSLPEDLAPGLYKLFLGVYNAPAGPRFSVASADRLLLPPMKVNVP